MLKNGKCETKKRRIWRGGELNLVLTNLCFVKADDYKSRSKRIWRWEQILRGLTKKWHKIVKTKFDFDNFNLFLDFFGKIRLLLV